MRKLLLFCSIIVLISIVNYACNQNKNNTPVKVRQHPDTLNTYVLYVHNPNLNQLRAGSARLIIKDSLMRDTTDATKNILRVDSSYSVWFEQPIFDSTGKVYKRKNGQDSIMAGWLALTKWQPVLEDFHTNFDSLIKIQLKP